MQCARSKAPYNGLQAGRRTGIRTSSPIITFTVSDAPQAQRSWLCYEFSARSFAIGCSGRFPAFLECAQIEFWRLPRSKAVMSAQTGFVAFGKGVQLISRSPFAEWFSPGLILVISLRNSGKFNGGLFINPMKNKWPFCPNLEEVSSSNILKIKAWRRMQLRKI